MGLIRRTLFALFPPPRRPVTWQMAWPLAAFLAGFALLCFVLEYRHILMFARPWALSVALFAPWIWWMHAAGYAGLPKVRGLMSLFVRLCLLGLFAMVLAEPRAVRSRDVISAMFVVDVSDSIKGENSEDAIKYVLAMAQKKPQTDEAGLIIFGKTPAVELPPRMSFPLEALNSQLERGSTNIEQALSLAAAMLPDDNQGRIVLISDGSQTEGSLARLLDELKSRQIAVDVLPIDYSYTQEVWLERLELPQTVKLGETYEAGMILSALTDGKGTLRLTENGQTIAEQEVEFKAGKNRYSVPIALRTPGYYEYTATIEAASDDSLSQNNSVLNYIFVEGEGRTLLVTDPQGDVRDWQKLEQSIREAERSVETIVADDLPADAAPMRDYDCIIFVNTPRDAFDPLQLQAVRDAVYNFGVGFVMIGGKNSFGPGGWNRSIIEEVLPVTMDVSQRKVLPKGALAIILHTCEFPDGNTWGKRITKEAIKVLGAQDEVGVLAYTQNGEEWVFKLTPAGEKDKIFPLIEGAVIGDMPSFVQTMEMGLKDLLASDASAKHMIIISDGDPQPAPPATIQKFIDNKISVSTVSIFPHGGMEISNMKGVAETTGGKYYAVNDDPNRLPAIFIKESKTLKRTMIRNEQITPMQNFPSPIMKGLEDGIPDLKGYVLATARDRAMTILQSPPDKEDPSQVDPLLAVWQYGLGKTAAFTSDLSPNWGAFWYDWDKYQAFVKQLLTDISRVRKEGSLRMSTYTNGGDGVIIVEDFHPDEEFLEISARVMGPNGKTESVPLKQVAPRRYQATLPLWGHGRYHVAVSGAAGERSDQAFGGFVVPYSPEYLRFRSNRQVLNEIVERTGGELLSGDIKKDEIFERGRSVKRSTKPIFDWFLIALAILVPLDVGLRRVQIDWSAIRSLFVFDRKKGPATATMGALLARKQEVSSELQSRRVETKPGFGIDKPGFPSQSAGAAKPQATAPPVVSPKPPAAAPPSDDKPTSTTERLLQLKRKRDEDKQ